MSQILPRFTPPLMSKPPPGAQREAAISFDESQQAVIACQDKLVVAEAFAGAGKTTTAVGFTDARPRTNALYVCFNRANAMEARQRFGAHVECKSTHALAWAAVGRRYSDQLVKGNWKARQFQEELGLAEVRVAAIAQSVLNRFFSSPDPKLSDHHLDDAKQQYGANEAELGLAMDAARLGWMRMQRPGEAISVPHDAYLKLWALSSPRLPFDQIILDEAQDTNPVVVDVIRRQRHAKMLLIGDRHQAIYGFRKAHNAMEIFSAMGATVLKMPRTWRFGPDIAKVANALLSHFKGETTAIIGAGPAKDPRKGSPRAVLSRTNAELFRDAAEVEGRGVYWVGGIEGYRVDALMDAWHLKIGQRGSIMSPVLRQYASWRQFEDEAQTTQDSESRLLCRFISQYNAQTPDLVRAFKARALPSEQGAKLVLATAHKSKGLDFDHVSIGEDFECLGKAHQAMLEGSGELHENHRQEINLLYVAATRARHRLSLNTETRRFVEKIGFHREQLQQVLQPKAAEQEDCLVVDSSSSAPSSR